MQKVARGCKGIRGGVRRGVVGGGKGVPAVEQDPARGEYGDKPLLVWHLIRARALVRATFRTRVRVRVRVKS